MRSSPLASLTRPLSLLAICALGFAPAASHACQAVIPTAELLVATEVAPTSILGAAAHVSTKSVTLKAYRFVSQTGPVLVAEEKTTPGMAQEKSADHALVIEAAEKTGCIAICQNPVDGLNFKAVERKQDGNCI